MDGMNSVLGSHRAPTSACVDGNEAAARVAYAFGEVSPIYPITPSPTMAELADEWAAAGRLNPWVAVPEVVEMQSEAGAAGTLHGALQKGVAPDADRVVVLMGSGSGAAEETVEALTATGGRVGLLKVRLYRPFPVGHLVRALPPTVRSIAVLDRTKEPGATGEPLLLDVITTLHPMRWTATCRPSESPGPDLDGPAAGGDVTGDNDDRQE